MNHKSIRNKISKYESRSMLGQMPIIWDSAYDEFVISNKKKYIDFTSTIFVSNIGHSNKTLVSKVKKTLSAPLLHTYTYLNPYRAEYLDKLIKFSKPYFQKAYLVSAGTEATEAALKLIRMNGLKINKRKKGLICFDGNWHGRTMGAQLMSGNESQKEWIGFRDPNIYHIKFPYPWDVNENNSELFLKKQIDNLIANKKISLNKDIAGFMLESFQGWGAFFYPYTFIKALEKICKKNKILLCFDEMQAGFGRTGKKFGFEHYDVKPDLICVGKGMGSGFPLSGVLGKSKIIDLPSIGSMSSTHSSNPISASAGSATLDVINKQKLVRRSERLGKLLFSHLNKIMNKYPNYISNICGKGMIAAIIFKDYKTKKPLSKLANKICDLCLKNQLIVVRTGRESIKIGPPLIIKEKNLIKGLTILDQCIKESIS